MKCAYCGCTDTQACPGGCHWVAPGVCSACADRPAPRAPLTGLVDLQAKTAGTPRRHSAAQPAAIAPAPFPAQRVDDRPADLRQGMKVDRVIAALRRGHRNSRAIADATWLTTAEVGAFLCQLHRRGRVSRTEPIPLGPGHGRRGRPMRDYTLIEDAADA